MHQKHPKIARPPQRMFGQTAYSLVGTNCERIETIMASWLQTARPELRCVGVTGDHNKTTWSAKGQNDSRQWMSPQGSWNEYDDRLQARAYDLALVNGNHYPAEKQIVFIDTKKAGTLERRQEQLTDIVAIVKTEETSEVPKWLEEKIQSSPQETAIYTINQLDVLLQTIVLPTARKRLPKLKALILTGGKSSRMGQNKADLIYRNGQTESARLTQLCSELELEVFHSVQQIDDQASIPQIGDRFLGLGPAGAIGSAFLYDPESAWLVLACDLPLLEKKDLEALIAARDSTKFATAIQGHDRPFPEPLIAIYEPRAYGRLLQFLSLGYACPRKMLINSDIATLLTKNNRPLTNANTPEERQNVLNQLSESV